MKKTPLVSRLEYLVERFGGRQATLASLVQVSPPTVLGWLKGSVPYDSTLKKIAERAGVSEHWLRTGEGEPDLINSGTPRDKLARAIALNKTTVPKLARRIGYDAGILQNVVYGTGKASEKMIEAITLALPGVTKEELMAGSDSAPILSEDGMSGSYGAKPRVQGVDGLAVPLISMAAAGTWEICYTDDGYDGETWFAAGFDDRRGFAIKVAGNSMEPDIVDGDVVVCSPKQMLHNGDCAVVRTHSNQALVKFYHRSGNEVTLKSANPAYKPLRFPLAEIAGAWPVVQHTSSGKIRRP